MPKDNNIARLRVLFTVWIVIYHSVNPNFISDPLFAISTPHMELEYLRGITNLVLQGFVFISGLLMARGYFDAGKYRDRLHFCAGKAKRLLLPYLFWSGVLLVFYPVSWQEVLCGAKHLWFLLMLFDVMLFAILFVFPCLERTRRLGDTALFFLCVVASAVMPKLGNVPNLLGWKTAVTYMPPFVGGVIFAKYQMERCLSAMGCVRFHALTALFAAWVALFIWPPSLPFGLFYMHLPNYVFLPLLYALFCRWFGPSGLSTGMKKVDRNSLGIYILHEFLGKYPLFAYVPSFVVFFDTHWLLAPVCLFAIMFPLAYVVSTLMHKHRTTAMLLGSAPHP